MALLRHRLANMITLQIVQIRPDVVMAMLHLVVNVEAVLTARRRVSFPSWSWCRCCMNTILTGSGQMSEALRFADESLHRLLTRPIVFRLFMRYRARRYSLPPRN